jgi:hypothetical protein
VLVEVVAEALFFSKVFDCVGDFSAVVAEAGDDTMTTLSPLVFFFLEVEDFDWTSSSWRWRTLTALGTLARLRPVQKERQQRDWR